MRAFAIFSVVCAHASTGSKHITDLILSSLGSIGVPVFFALSGYFFCFNQRSWKSFWLNKLKSIFIPWMFCGTLDWLYVVIRKGNITFSYWLDAVFVHSHFYYLSVLVILYALFWKIKDSLRICGALALLSAVCIVCTGQEMFSIYPYINVGNWVLYFVFGIWIAKNDLMEKVVEFCNRFKYAIPILYIGIMVLFLAKGRALSYWCDGSVVIEIFAILTIVCLSIFVSRTKKFKKILQALGQYSFTIYLIHMPFSGVITYIMRMYFLDNMVYLVSPFLVISIVFCVALLVVKLFEKAKIRNIIYLLLGKRV